MLGPEKVKGSGSELEISLGKGLKFCRVPSLPRRRSVPWCSQESSYYTLVDQTIKQVPIPPPVSLNHFLVFLALDIHSFTCLPTTCYLLKYSEPTPASKGSPRRRSEGLNLGELDRWCSMREEKGAGLGESRVPVSECLSPPNLSSPAP